jgi:endonuclease/exonuclease/phosphatase family metal-dependent hydrolase
LWLEISLKDEDTLLLGYIYRSPLGSLPEQKETTSQLCRLFSLATAMNPTHLVIMGDFNFPDIDWKNGLSTAGIQHHSHDFICTTQDSLLFQHVLEPTRYRPGTAPNLLDLIFSNEDGIISNLSYLPGLGESDHQCLDFTLECYGPHPP